MKNSFKRTANSVMMKLFGHTPYPSPTREKLEFERKEFPVRHLSCNEFNALAFYIHNLNRNFFR